MGKLTIDIDEVVERVVDELDGDERVEKMVVDTLNRIAKGDLNVDADDGDADEDDDVELVTKSEVEEMISKALEDDGDEEEDEESEEEDEESEENEESEEDSEEEDEEAEEEEEEEEEEAEKSISASDVERIVKREVRNALKGVKVSKGKQSLAKSDRVTADSFDPEKCEKVSDIPDGWIEKIESGEIAKSRYEKLPKDVRNELLANRFRPVGK